MYIIEAHYPNRAFSQIILEKSDTPTQLEIKRVVFNHIGVEEKQCKWCKFKPSGNRTQIKNHQ